MTKMTLLKREQIKPGGEYNARTRYAGDIDALAENIKTVGLLQPILVRPIEDGDYQIIAGNRRFAAINKLNGMFDNGIPVLVREVDDQAAVALSLTENDQRMPMHPIERMEAFAKMEKEGASVEGIAATFNADQQAVRRALKLGSLIKPVRDELASQPADRVRWNAVHALCQQSEKKQRKLWKDHDGDLYAIQSAIKSQTNGVGKYDPRRNIISIEDYTAAGGVVDGDLFAEEGDLIWKSTDIVDKMVANWTASKIKQLTDDGWSDVKVVTNDNWYSKWDRIYPSHDESLAPAEKVAQAAELEKWLDANDPGDPNDGSDEYEDKRDQLFDLEAEIREACEVYTPEQKASGTVMILPSFDLVQVTPKGGAEPAKQGEEEDVQISNALKQDLDTLSSEAVQQAMQDRPLVGAALALYTMLERRHERWAFAPVNLTCEPMKVVTEPLSMPSDLAEKMKPYFRAKKFETKLLFLVNLTHETLVELMAHCAAVYLSAGGKGTMIREFFEKECPNVVEHHLPVMTQENYFGRLNKRQLLAVSYAEGVGLDPDLKKKEAAIKLQEALPQNWLPPELS